MAKYIDTGLNLSNNQKEKIINAASKNVDVTIQLKKQNLRGNDIVPLTSTQIKHINKGIGFRLHLSKSQLKSFHSKIIKESEKTGGFLPLLTLLPLLFGGLGAAGALAGGVSSAVSNSKTNAEQVRHNKAIEAELAKGAGIDTLQISKLKKGGCVECGGMCMQKLGNGLFLAPASNGQGLFLGPYRP